MNLSEIIAGIAGPTAYDHRPEGGSDVTPLAPLGLDRVVGEMAPTSPGPQQGAGGGSSLTPAANITDVGTIHTGGNRPDSSNGPDQLKPSSGIASLTANGNRGANRPS